tara:strand:+ start:695 stop:1309 length:615 start_codon:yes stop_codon:yes gene_type:complete
MRHSEKVLFMRVFLSVLVLILSLQSFTKADDISDFEIEGISVGDSLLDHYSINEINEALKNPSYYKNKIFVEIFVNYKGSEFDYLQVALQTNDKTFIIEKIMLVKDFTDKIQECKKFKEKLINDSSDFTKDSNRIDNEDIVSKVDPTGNSLRSISTFFYSTGGFFNFICTDYGQEMFEKHGWFDNFSVSVGSKKIEKFLQGDAY